MQIQLFHFDIIDSTNSEALRQARTGAKEGVCVVARQQTAGRGRHGRVWVSENDAGLYFSIVLRPKLSAEQLPLITLMAGVAVHDTLKEFGLSPDIKWVNDVLVGGRKISGILAETAETELGIAVVVGIGINIRSTNYPPEIADTATSIEASSARIGGASVPSAEQLSQVLSNYLVHFYELLSSHDGGARIIAAWKERSTYFAGKSVRVVQDHEILEGITDGLQNNGALRLRLSNDRIKVINAGDVTSLRSLSTEAGETK